MSDEDAADEVLDIILRRDGSIRYDRMRQGKLEEIMPPEAWQDAGLNEVRNLTSRGVFNPLREPLGNIGLELFMDSREHLFRAQNAIGISNSRYSTPLVEAIGLTLSDLERREPRAREAEMIMEDPDGGASLLQDTLELELTCNHAGKSKKKQESCRHSYWKLWEFAWARRLFIPEDHIIEALESIYTRYPFLDNRNGQRRAPLPPGNMMDPRIVDGHEVELF